MHVNERGDIAFHFISSGAEDRAAIRWADGTIEDVVLQHETPYVGYFAPRVWGLSDTGEALVLYDAFAEGMPDQRRIYRYSRGGESQLAASVGRSPLSNAWGGASGHAAFLAAGADPNAPDLILLDASNRQTYVGRPGGGDAIIWGVNAHGDAAGFVETTTDTRPLRVSHDGSSEILTSLERARGAGINNNGTVTGYTSVYIPGGEFGEGSEVFLWHAGETTATILDLPDGYHGARAFALNDSEWIVGELVERVAMIGASQDTVRHAMLYTPEEGFINLNDLLADELDGAHLIAAHGINEAGMIVGEAVLANGDAAVFTITIPAPAASLPLAALAFAAPRHRRR